jgi:hypothetical protein
MKPQSSEGTMSGAQRLLKAGRGLKFSEGQAQERQCELSQGRRKHAHNKQNPELRRKSTYRVQ